MKPFFFHSIYEHQTWLWTFLWCCNYGTTLWGSFLSHCSVYKIYTVSQRGQWTKFYDNLHKITTTVLFTSTLHVKVVFDQWKEYDTSLEWWCSHSHLSLVRSADPNFKCRYMWNAVCTATAKKVAHVPWSGVCGHIGLDKVMQTQKYYAHYCSLELYCFGMSSQILISCLVLIKGFISYFSCSAKHWTNQCFWNNTIVLVVWLWFKLRIS